ncbi:DivIVA domain-containing protein [Anaerosporobacter sp.]
MLTPIEIQSKSFKTGIGYDRKDVDAFMREILVSYEKLYKEDVELKDKINVLNERLQYYKTIEKTLQKALVLAEQTAEETRQAALKNAQAIEKEAQGKVDFILADAQNELNHINRMITGLTQQYESYKVQYKQLAAAQIELLQSPTFELTLMNGEQLKTSYTNPIDEDDENTDNVSNIDDSDYTVIEEAAPTLDNDSEVNTDTTDTISETDINPDTDTDIINDEVKNETSSESEFEFLDFEVNLD